MKKYIIHLSDEEVKSCRAIISRGRNKADVIRRAYILLKSHDGKTDMAIAAELYLDDETVRRTRMRYVESGLEAALETATPPGSEPLLKEDQVAYLTALACSSPPAGQNTLDVSAAGRADGCRWRGRSHQHQHRGTLPEKNALKPWRVKSGCIPLLTRLFIEQMEAILYLYQQPYDP